MLLLAGSSTVAATPSITPVQAPVSAPKRTLTAFLDELRRDSVLRARFAQAPRAVLVEYGIDPPAFDLPDHYNEVQLNRLLGNSLEIATQAVPPKETQSDSGTTKPLPKPDPKNGVPQPKPVEPLPTPPAPVYGPPAGPRR
jgi:hypothetical protein